ncbi:MAG: J domain-containing protein [Robiginitomaculum sp.]
MTRHEAIMALGLSMSANEPTICRAWRKKAKFYHPDSPYGNMAAFLKCKQAFETLVPPAPQTMRVRAGSRTF